MFVGIPASGKSTESAKYRALGYNILSSDEIRDSISGGLSLQSVPAKEASALHSQVFQRINQLCRESLKQGISVVVDATNLNRKRRIAFLKQFISIKCMKKCVLPISH